MVSDLASFFGIVFSDSETGSSLATLTQSPGSSLSQGKETLLSLMLAAVELLNMALSLVFLTAKEYPLC
jgi:hypothetical protein